MFAILCHNPTAGSGNYSKIDLLAALELAGVEANYCSTQGDNFPEMLKQSAELIISAGGDGTVAKVIKNLPDRDVPIAILPLGTANNIARSLGIAGTPHELAESWRFDRWQPFHIGLACGPWGQQYFVEAVGLGSLARTVKKANGKLAGAAKLIAGRRALRETLAEAEPIDADITIDGVPLPGEAKLAVEMVNTSYTGPGLPLAPAVTPADGKLGIVTIRSDDREAMISWLEAPHRDPLPVAVRLGRKVECTWNGAPLRLDDDLIEVPRGPHSGTFELAGRSVKFLVSPPKAQLPG
jgi:diacylglycerol kinase family enzyme